MLSHNWPGDFLAAQSSSLPVGLTENESLSAYSKPAEVLRVLSLVS